MRTSIATVCLAGTLDEKLHACAAAGFDGVEIFEQDLIVSPMSPEEVRALADRLGLNLYLYQPFRDAEGVTEEVFAKNLLRAEAKFRLMNRLGIETMLVCSNVATLTEPDDDVCAAQLRRLGELADSFGVRIAYEALAWGAYVNTYRHAHRIVERADHHAVGTCVDSFHILSRGDDPSGIEEIESEKLFFVQLADAPALSMDVLSWSRHYRLFPGQGVFELPDFLACLGRAGYAGPVSLEIFNDTFRQTDVQATARDGMRSLMWLQDRAASLAGQANSGMPLAALPRAAPASGLDFMEIRTQAPEAVAQLLDQLGLAFCGQHRRKPVQLWVQGQARIILTSQQGLDSAASISGIGLQVPDPAAALRRSLALGAVRVPRHHTADEQPLPGVAAPDGLSVFVSESTTEPQWLAEFGAHPSGSDGLITGFDHVNLAQPWDAFDESVLFYESVFQLTARTAAEVASPAGLVRSQVFESADGGVRLVLNIVPQSRSDDPYPEHIALQTPDIVAVARAARSRGMQFLAIPHNYYDDLAARTNLPSGKMALLRELDLLYDQDESGEFMHFYTATVGGLFFEVVQRCGDYRGFGAPNAPVRLASQFQKSDRSLTRARG